MYFIIHNNYSNINWSFTVKLVEKLALSTPRAIQNAIQARSVAAESRAIVVKVDQGWELGLSWGDRRTTMKFLRPACNRTRWGHVGGCSLGDGGWCRLDIDPC